MKSALRSDCSVPPVIAGCAVDIAIHLLENLAHFCTDFLAVTGSFAFR